MSIPLDPYTEHMRARLDKYFKGKLVCVYVSSVQIPMSSEGFAETFVGYVHEVDIFDLVIRNISENQEEPDRFTLIPITGIKAVSEVGSISKAIEAHRSDEAKRQAIQKSLDQKKIEPGFPGPTPHKQKAPSN